VRRDSRSLSEAAVTPLLAQLQAEWSVSTGQPASLQRDFHFPDYYRTLAFVNAVAWIAHEQDHHPDLSVHYNRCQVRYSTHSIGGLSRNDFICAARIDQLIAHAG